jgi:hypothetical protein
MKSPRIVQLIFAMAVFGGVGTAFADISYSFTTFDVPGATALAEAQSFLGDLYYDGWGVPKDWGEAAK